ncbi:MAG: uridine kinase [Clostridiaceae bacterium]
MKNEKNYISYKVFYSAMEAIKELLEEDRDIIIGIDGRCGSGKSTLGALLKEAFPCNVLHMDDFFLPSELRTPDRMKEPGGNVHYERFAEEVMKPLQEKKDVFYRRFCCGTDSFLEPVRIGYKKLTVIEGSYSLHPTLDRYYSYKIFLTVKEKEQLERIEKRSGKDKLQLYIDKWIPLEERYFSFLKIEEACDLIVDTTMCNKM